MYRLLAFLLITIFFLGCSSNSDTEIYHPTEANLPTSSSGNLIDSNEGEVQNNKISKVISELETKESSAKVGELYGAEEEMFGFIQDVVIDSLNRLYFLDKIKQLIHVFDTNGDFIQTLGREGRGPGEFENANSLAIYNDQLLYVGNGYRLEVYDISSEDIEFVKTVQLNKKNAYSICIINNVLYLHNNRLLELGTGKKNNTNINMLHAYSLPSNELKFSFGQSYKSETPMVVNRMTSGNISCNESSSTVILAYEQMPVIQGYSANDGQIKWKSLIKDLHYADIIQSRNEKGKTRMTFRMPESNTIDRIFPTTRLNGEYELLQVKRIITPDEGYETKREVLSYLLDSSSGEGTYIGKSISSILSNSNNLAVSVSDDFITSDIIILQDSEELMSSR